MTSRHRLEIARDAFKFSCAHMTVFPDGTKERLHGHNYTVGVAVELAAVDFARMVPFAPIKDATVTLCREWRERTLLAAENPYLEIVRDTDSELEFRLCGERYVLPRQDVLLLPIDNIAVESLAAHVAAALSERLAAALRGVAIGLEVRVEESPGQGATCWLPLSG